MKALLSSAYWPNLHQFYYFLNCDKVLIESHDNYQKQSFRNRTIILSANGPLDLSIPIRNTADASDMLISYTGGWQRIHWGAITSAYQNSPFFEFFSHLIHDFYKNEKYESLRDYNLAQLACIYDILKLKVNFENTSSYLKQPEHILDLRETIHPKKKYTTDERVIKKLSTPYYQTFSEKFPFVEKLSILDLVFNMGLKAKDYLLE